METVALETGVPERSVTLPDSARSPDCAPRRPKDSSHTNKSILPVKSFLEFI